jgi:hypothetical protein
MNPTATRPILGLARTLTSEQAAALEQLKVSLRSHDATAAVRAAEEIGKAKAQAEAAERADRAVTAKLARAEAKAAPSKTQQRREETAAMMEPARKYLKQRLPRYPYATGVAGAFKADLPADVTLEAIRFALAERSRSEAYLKALVSPGARRYGLGGVDAGPVSDEDRVSAQKRLETLRHKQANAARAGNGSNIRVQASNCAGSGDALQPREHPGGGYGR